MSSSCSTIRWGYGASGIDSFEQYFCSHHSNLTKLLGYFAFLTFPLLSEQSSLYPCPECRGNASLQEAHLQPTTP